MTTRRALALFGVLATVTAMAAGHFVASLLNPAASPVLVMGSTVIDLTPTPVKQWAIKTFESDGFSLLFIDFPAMNYDKVILVGSVLIGALVLAGLAGTLARRSFSLAVGLLLGLVALATILTLLRPGAEVIDIIPGLVTALVGFSAFWWLVRTATGVALLAKPEPKQRIVLTDESGPRPDEAAAADTSTTSGSSRRGVLIAGGALAIAAAAMGTAGRAIGRVRSRISDITFPAASDPAPALPQGLENKIKGITPLQVSREDFYRVDTRLDTPIVDVDSWTLTIDGDVSEEVEFTFDDILEMDLIERDITLTCVSNSVGGKYVGGARWLGVRLTDLLDRAGVGDKADQLFATDFDGMTISTPLAAVTDGRDAMLAIAMNGEALPREHGFPARIVIPGLYGFISATKWVTKLTLTTYEEKDAYWTERDWATDAPIKISSRIDTPRALEQVSKGEVVVGGIAWAQQNGGVAKVEVRIDGGAWQEAELGPDVNNDYWRQWAYRWDAQESGLHTVGTRVTDGDGNTQTAARATPFPAGASGWHEYQVTVT